MLKKLVAGGIFCALIMTQVLIGVADAAPATAPKESVVQEAADPQAAAGSVMQATRRTFLYKSASTKSDKRLTLGAGNKVRVIRDYGTWTKVNASGKTGYVLHGCLKAAAKKTSSKTNKAGTVIQPTKTTYMYESKSTKSGKRLTLRINSKAKVEKDYGTWTKVSASGKTGYVLDGYFKTAGTTSSASTVPYSSTSKASINTDQVSRNIIRVKLTGANGKKLKVKISKESSKTYYDLSIKTGYQSLPLNMGTGTYDIGVLENISGNSYKYISSKTVSVSGNSNGAYLISTSEISFTSSMAPIRLAASLTSGKSTGEKVKAVYDWVVSHIDYDYEKNPPAGYVPGIVDTYNTKKGICYDFAALFAAMLRSQGVPTKLVKGYADNVSGYHAWNEVYVGGKWYTVDTSHDAQVRGSMYKSSGYHKTSES